MYLQSKGIDYLLELSNNQSLNEISVDGKNYLAGESFLESQKSQDTILFQEGFLILYEDAPAINSELNGAIQEINGEKIKSVETARLMACFNQTAKLKASIMGELHNNGQLITIPRDAFVKIFNDAIVEASTDKEKETIINILNRLGDLSKSAQ